MKPVGPVAWLLLLTLYIVKDIFTTVGGGGGGLEGTPKKNQTF